MVEDLEHHPLGQLLDAHVAATVDSDELACFGGYLTDNLVRVTAARPDYNGESANTEFGRPQSAGLLQARAMISQVCSGGEPRRRARYAWEVASVQNSALPGFEEQ